MSRAPHSAMHVLLCLVGTRHLGIPLEHVERVVRAAAITPLPGAPRWVLGVVTIDGTPRPVYDLTGALGATVRPLGLDDRFVLVATARRGVVLRVDEVLDVRPCAPVAHALLHDPHGVFPALDGVAETEDGLVLIHHPDRFLSAVELLTLDDALAAASPA